VPLVERAPSGDPGAILDAYAKRGFNMIGYSLFNSGRPESEAGAVRQGQDVGADLVLIHSPIYTGSTTSSLQISRPISTTSNVSGTATVYGSRGPVTAYGSGTITTNGVATSYIPVTVHRSDYAAVYFVKQRYGLGVFTRDLNDTERQQLQTNKGAAVLLVVDATPAFDADILVGDVITSIDGVSITGTEVLGAYLQEHRGKTIAISILRGGRRIEKSVTLNS
jgi:hypothetical protein